MIICFIMMSSIYYSKRMSWYLFKDAPSIQPRGIKVDGYHSTLTLIQPSTEQKSTFPGA
jgi:hypothetical protein